MLCFIITILFLLFIGFLIYQYIQLGNSDKQEIKGIMQTGSFQPSEKPKEGKDTQEEQKDKKDTKEEQKDKSEEKQDDKKSEESGEKTSASSDKASKASEQKDKDSDSKKDSKILENELTGGEHLRNSSEAHLYKNQENEMQHNYLRKKH